MATDEADPVALAPYTWPHRYFGIELDTHLKVALQRGLGDRERVRSRGGATLEATDHGIEVSFLGCLRRGMLGGRAIDRFMKYRVVRVVLLHGVEVGRALEKMCALAAGVFGSD